MLNVHQLNVFLTAAETLNFTQTAKKLHLTQSSVSQHIKSLENQLEVQLFVRKGRSIALSAAGGILLPMARDIVEGSIRAAEQMELLKQEVHGHLIVGCNTAPGKYMLPLILAQFHDIHPLVRITCTVLPQQQTMDGLAEGVIHFAITNVRDMDRSHAEFQLYLEEPIVLIAPLDHPWADREYVEAHELDDYSYIMRDPGSGTYQNVARSLNTVGVDVTKLDTLMEMGTSEATALAVEQGLGVGFVSLMILDKICPNRVAVVPIKGLDIRQEIFLARQTHSPATGAQAAFWDFVRNTDISLFYAKDGAEHQTNALVAPVEFPARVRMTSP